MLIKFFRNGILLSIIGVVSLITAGNAVTYKWKLDKNKNGYQIYISKVPGQRFDAAKCVSVVNAPIEVIGTVLRDIPAMTQWMADCKEARVLKVVNDAKDIIIFYFHQGVPVIKDRDIVLKAYSEYRYDKGYVKVGFNATNEMNYTKKGIIRMKGMTGMWKLEPLNSKSTRCTYMVNANIGGSVPGWLANTSIRELPLKSMKGLKRMVKMPKYIERAKKSKYYKKAQAARKKGLIKE